MKALFELFLNLFNKYKYPMEKKFKRGDIVWAKVRGFPWWPGVVKATNIKQVKDDKDTRKKKLFLDKEGRLLFDKIYEAQKKRIFNALKTSEPDSVVKFKNVLTKIINGTK